MAGLLHIEIQHIRIEDFIAGATPWVRGDEALEGIGRVDETDDFGPFPPESLGFGFLAPGVVPRHGLFARSTPYHGQCTPAGDQVTPVQLHLFDSQPG